MSILTYTPAELTAMDAKPDVELPVEGKVLPKSEEVVEEKKVKRVKKKVVVVEQTDSETDDPEQGEVESSDEEEDPPPKLKKKKAKEELFDKKPPVRISKKTGKPVKELSEKQLENLRTARAKGLEKRQKMAIAKKKEFEVEKLEKTRHIRERKKKVLEQDALIMAHAQDEVEKKEKAGWNEDRMAALMNRTLDTYMEKREKAKQLRTTIPAPPEGYMYYPGQPPQRMVPKKPVRPASPDPYAGMFGFD
tara:strand:+ start:532 stop:1278 length:747 start_codon:yes stop_codon:yes gene_type:complete